MITNKEKEILEMIQANPLLEQSEIARRLGISRSTAAVHISSLQKKGYLRGRGYIVDRKDYVLGIGAANLDIYGKSKMKIRLHYDHPADVGSSVGGVTRNILGNLSRLGVPCRIMTAVGDDSFGKVILDRLNSEGIDTADVLIKEGGASGVFMQVMDDKNDMHLALCDMSVLEELTPSYLRKKAELICGARLVVCDPSISDESMKELLDICQGKVDVYVDPISDNYAEKIAPYFSRFTGIKPNRSELEALSGMKIESDDDLYNAAAFVIEKGVKKLFVSLSEDGILYMDSEGRRIRRRLKPVKDMVNASGAGDAMLAALLYGEMNDMDINEELDYGLAAGIAAISCKETINPDMSIGLIKEILKTNQR